MYKTPFYQPDEAENLNSFRFLLKRAENPDSFCFLLKQAENLNSFRFLQKRAENPDLLANDPPIENTDNWMIWRFWMISRKGYSDHPEMIGGSLFSREKKAICRGYGALQEKMLAKVEMRACNLIAKEGLTPEEGNIEANERVFSIVMGPEHSGQSTARARIEQWSRVMRKSDGNEGPSSHDAPKGFLIKTLQYYDLLHKLSYISSMEQHKIFLPEWKVQT
ncbi:hypothetical protein IEQ34_014269 [Dendrobium chrysotoxum]|uniref:Uncharacterized protein n=1 Tax=Dendrobium chrysotoxum TaxID=161865 RepID=A0AAV7GLH9_DENCH|nr:hypothetical protein IEQ34_014269 [Dendrobium chrysotoxum]